MKSCTIHTFHSASFLHDFEQECFFSTSTMQIILAFKNSWKSEGKNHVYSMHTLCGGWWTLAPVRAISETHRMRVYARPVLLVNSFFG